MIKGILVDLSGTLHIENHAIPGSIEALDRLRMLGYRVKFLSNTTKESQSQLHERLKKLGFNIEKNEIFTSLTAAKNLIIERNLRPTLLIDECAMEDFNGLDVSNPNAVVIGLAPRMFDYSYMNQAFRQILNGAEFIAIHKSKYFRKPSGILALGPGPFVAGLEYATNREAIIVGKPSLKFFQMGLAELGTDLKPEETVMIGDDVTDDVLGGISAGMKGILVKTGKYRQNDEEILPLRRNVVASFPAAVDLIVNGDVL